jgi:hypothetical protein
MSGARHAGWQDWPRLPSQKGGRQGEGTVTLPLPVWFEVNGIFGTRIPPTWLATTRRTAQEQLRFVSTVQCVAGDPLGEIRPEPMFLLATWLVLNYHSSL